MAEQEYGRIDIVKSGESAEVYTAIYPQEMHDYLMNQLGSFIGTVATTPGMHVARTGWSRDTASNKEEFDQFVKDIRYICTHPNVRACQQFWHGDSESSWTVDIDERKDNGGMCEISTTQYEYSASGNSFLMRMRYGVQPVSDYVYVTIYITHAHSLN